MVCKCGDWRGSLTDADSYSVGPASANAWRKRSVVIKTKNRYWVLLPQVRGISSNKSNLSRELYNEIIINIKKNTLFSCLGAFTVAASGVRWAVVQWVVEGQLVVFLRGDNKQKTCPSATSAQTVRVRSGTERVFYLRLPPPGVHADGELCTVCPPGVNSGNSWPLMFRSGNSNREREWFLMCKIFILP